MNYAVCSAASVSKPARATLSAWIRAFLPWQRTNAKTFSTPGICCLVTMCQSTLPKGRHRVSKSLIARFESLPQGEAFCSFPRSRGRGPEDVKGKRAMEPTREIYGNIVGGELVYLAMVISFGLVGWALYRHYCLWMQGRPDNRVQDLWRRLKVMLVQGLGQQKTLREWPGMLHFFVYAGFIVLFIGTLM